MPSDATGLMAEVAAALGHRLHQAGLPVTPERSTRFAAAVAAADPVTRRDLYWLARVTLVTGRDQLEVFDRVYREVFEAAPRYGDVPSIVEAADNTSGSAAAERDAPREEQPEGMTRSASPRTQMTPGATAEEGEQQEEEPSMLAAVSVQERLADRSFAACTAEELALLAMLAERLPVVPPPRRGRRLRRHVHGSRLDVRATLTRSHRTAGDPVELVHRRRTTKPRRVVLLADVSGSMEPYARVYLHLMRGAVQALHAEAFAFATRLTRLTRALAEARPDVAYRKALEAAPDWSGGTRIGRALQTFLDEHGRRGVARGAVVVIVSDGWEIDSPELVGESMQRLSRLAHHVIWVNPRKAAESYEPLVGGMAAALPFVDTFVSGHSLRALEEVMDAIRNATERTPAPTRNPTLRVTTGGPV